MSMIANTDLRATPFVWATGNPGDGRIGGLRAVAA
jgi:hypothetical protein